MSLHVHHFGDQTPGARQVLALHGWGGSHLTFSPLVPHLPPGICLVCPDLPGYGDTPGLASWTLAAYVDGIVDVVDTLGTAPVVHLGNCSGAVFGLLVALRRPNRFEHHVLIDPFAWTPWYLRTFLLPVMGRVAYYSTFANPLGRWLTDQALAEHRQADSSLTASFTRVDHAAALETLRLLDQVGRVHRFAPVSGPHHIVHGARTFRDVIRGLDDWRSIWPGVHVTALPDVGHLPLQEAPEAVMAAMLPALHPAMRAVT